MQPSVVWLGRRRAGLESPLGLKAEIEAFGNFGRSRVKPEMKNENSKA